MIISNEQLKISSRQIFNRIGYEDGNEPSSRIQSLVHDYIDNYQDFLTPTYAYTIRDIISTSSNQVITDDFIVLKSLKLTRLLERCKKVAIFALTIGDNLEDMVAYLASQGLVLKASVLDAIGSGAAEKLAGMVEDKIKVMAAMEGMVTSRRFSPGYCDWQVDQQRMVFQLLKDLPHGVTLTDSCLMIPQKSISGIIGLGPPHNDVEKYNPCISCSKKECPGRRR
ncbi:MAG: hypothetical protein JXA46_03470 [Dehalococcoidales bacterium]|nr:hypothetical protein [Dehalococcoidales bacterium]